MKTNGQVNGHGKSNENIDLRAEAARLQEADRSRAYAAGFRECFGLLNVVVNELPTDARLRYIDKLQELYEKLRAAERSAGVEGR